jgi:MFS transporter, CP family, cyanate transporter
MTENGSIEESQPKKYRWVMLCLVSLLYAAFGLVSRSMSPLVTPILKDLNISFSQMGIILGAWQLTYIGVAAVGGAIIDRWGIRKSLLAGILIIGLSEILRYFANGFTTLLIFVGLFGLGGPMISIGCPKTISEWFSVKERGTAVGIYMAGSAIGGLIAFSTVNSILMPFTGYNWRIVFVLCSLPAFASAVLWWFMSRDLTTKTAAGGSGIIKVFTDLVRIRDVQLILVMGLFSFMITHGFTNWLPKILETGGLPPSIAGLAASIPIIVGIPMVILIPRMVAAHARRRGIAIIALALAVSVFMVIKSSGIPLVIWLVIYGLFFSTVMPLLILELMSLPEVGSKYMGSAGGMFFCIAEIGGFTGPSFLGFIKEATNSFLFGAILMSALALSIAVMALFLTKRPVSKDVS